MKIIDAVVFNNSYGGAGVFPENGITVFGCSADDDGAVDEVMNFARASLVRAKYVFESDFKEKLVFPINGMGRISVDDVLSDDALLRSFLHEGGVDLPCYGFHIRVHMIGMAHQRFFVDEASIARDNQNAGLGNAEKWFRVFGSNTVGRFVRREGEFVVLDVVGIGKKYVNAGTIIELA